MNPRLDDTWILAGPTASGKTALALALARIVPLEIISVDSALVYRGMDIGTAKPTPQERAEVPHHLIDIIDPQDSYSAARFVADATRLMAEIRARGRLPLLVGGTMLYIKALVDGLDEIPASDPDVRRRLDERARQEGWPALHAELAQVDPVTAARLAPNDAQRIQRALEVWHTAGRPISAFQRQRHGVRAGSPASTDSTDSTGKEDREPGTGQHPGPSSPPPRTQLISLEPADRAWLHRRINLRFEQMMRQGFVDEVRRLRARPDLHLGLPSMRCVGYRQVWEALDAGADLDQSAVLAQVMERGAAATRQLAKRQLTWLRGMPWRTAVACDQPDAAQQVAALLASALGSR